MVVAAVAVVAAAVVVPLVLTGSGAGGGGSIPAARPEPAYRVVYRVTTLGAPGSTEEHEVERPYLGRTLTISGTKTIDGQITNADGLWEWTHGGWVKLASGLHRSVGDYLLTPALQVALRRGQATVLGHRTVLGRPCTLVRTGGPVGAPLARPTDRDHDDICVDRTGVALTDRWVYLGKVTRTATAVAFSTADHLPEGTFSPTPAGPSVSPENLPEVSKPLPASGFSDLGYRVDPPDGFRADGGFVTVPIDHGMITGPPMFTEHFVRGTRLIDLIEGSLTGPFSPHGTPVRVPVGRAALDVELAGSTLEVVLPDYTYAYLQGPDPDELVRAARSLRANPASGSSGTTSTTVSPFPAGPSLPGPSPTGG